MSADGVLLDARQAYEDRSWLRAYELFDAAEHLGAEDLDRFAVAAMVAGRMSEYFAIRERAYRQLVAEGDPLGAAQAALWSGMQLLIEGEVVAGNGWLARAARLVEEDGTDSAAAGFLQLSRTFALMGSGDLEGAVALTREAIATGRRHGSDDLVGLALHHEGLLLLELGRTAEALARFDEAMVELSSGSLSPMVTGIVYCGALTGCWSVYELLRVEQWTTAMAAWCESQSDVGNFTGECQIHRAELQQLHGQWEQARVGLEPWSSASRDRLTAARAAYVRGNLDRLQGRYDAAEEQFAEAGRLGCDPQPGLALLRLARGGEQAAAAMLRRCLAEEQDNARRVEILVAAVDVFVTVGDHDAAREATDELGVAAARSTTTTVEAFRQHALARILLAGGRPEEALGCGRAALRTWIELAAPYEEARTRLLIAEACRLLDDAESADREQAAAHGLLRDLGVSVDDADDVLSARELEVLRWVATGATNREVAAELVLSERTVDRHVSNIFAKLGVSTRAAATAYALRRGLA